MGPPRFRRALVLATVFVVFCGCGGDDDPGAPEVVEGRIISLDYDRGALRSFTVRERGGQTHELFLLDDVSTYGFDLAHLEEHRDDREPVRCDVEERDGKLLALTIEDV